MDGTTGRGTVSLPVSSIVLDLDAWPRASFDEDRIALFANLYEERGATALPAVEVCVQGGVAMCSDGAHRLVAAEVAELDELPATLIEVGDGEDLVAVAYLRAIRASTKGHKELTRAERQRVIRRLVEETDLGDAEIAELVGVSRQTVWRHRQPRVADGTRERGVEAGDDFLATVAALEVAEQFFRGIQKVFEARGLGLWDSLTHDHTGERLARVLERVYGDGALERAEDFRGWCDAAIAELLAGGRS
jgi:hypothetical protein